MEAQNEKGGSMGSQRSKGSSTGEGPGKMNQGTGPATETTGLGKASGGNTGGRTETSSETKTRSTQRHTEGGDGMFSDLGINKNQVLTALGVVAGGALLYKGAKAFTGKRAAYDKKAIVDINTTLKVKRPKEELYAYWRNLENLPNFMSHIGDVQELSDKKSEWTAEVPGGLGTIEWEAEIIWEQKNHSIAWKSLPDSEIENSGEVRFHDAGNGKSTIVEARISYRPTAGKAGGLAAKLLNPAFKKVVENDLKEFKNLMEKGGGAKHSNALDRMY